MKKSIVLILLAVSMLVFAACSNNGVDDDMIAPSSDSDISDLAPIEKTPEELAMEADTVSRAIGIEIGIVGDYPVTGYTTNGETQAQIEFKIGENMAMGRAALGQQSNMSGVTSTFTHVDTVEVDGVSATVRYMDNDEPTTYAAETMGTIEGYDSDADISYCVILLGGADKDNLSAAFAALMAGTKIVSADEPIVE